MPNITIQADGTNMPLRKRWKTKHQIVQEIKEYHYV